MSDITLRLISENKDLREQLREFSGPPPGGPTGPDTETRLAKLEEGMKDLKSILVRLEPSIIRTEEQLRSSFPHLATKSDTVSVSEKLSGIEKRLSTLESTMDGALKTAVSKIPGGFQIVLIFTAILTLSTAVVNLSNGRAAWQFQKISDGPQPLERQRTNETK